GGQSNFIAFNGGAGVAVADGSSNTIRTNHLYDNAGLGIDLGPVGVTPNDEGDGDGGANDLQNTPVLRQPTAFAGFTTLLGTLNTTPRTTVIIDFYASTLPDPSGFGEGRFWRGFILVTTDDNGDASFAAQFSTFPGAPFY